MADDLASTSTPEDELEPEVKEPKESKGWLALIETARKAFDTWQLKCDNIDKLYANLERLASSTREREFQLFWANVQVLGPSIYSRPPVPVVVPRFKDRRPIARTSSEVLERTAIVSLEMQDINGVMVDLRNDLTTISRGQVWIRLDEKDKKPYVCVDHVSRRDFLHDPARTWKEVDWVAKCSWLTKTDARKRFKKTSGDAYRDAAYTVRKKDEDGHKEGDNRLKAPIWELWSKSSNLVVWVAEGCEKVLDEDKPHLELEGFFPCPMPTYGTLQRGSLVPVPDVLFYKDQLEEINEITGRIAALTEAVKVKGFYPAGAGNISDAIEAAVKNNQNNVTLVPIANWAAMGTGDPKDMVLWWPIEQVALVIKELIELRKQLMDDVYQITGLSDIMRGSTVASETLGAQELKSQYGSVRIRDRQGEMVRMARDITRIACEVISENYPQDLIAAMSQMELPTDKDIAQQIDQLAAQKQQMQMGMAQAQQDPAIQQQIQANPEKAQEVMGQMQEQLQALDGQIEELGQTVTIDAVVKFLRDNRMRAFSLDIETDSTIQPDEDAAKQRATEYLTAMSSVLQQAIPAVQGLPQIAPLMSEIIQFANKQFRIGRTMETVVEEFTDQMKEMASQPRPDPAAAEQQAAQAQAQMAEQTKQAQIQADGQTTQAQIASDEKIAIAKSQSDAQVAVSKDSLEQHKITTASADTAAKNEHDWRKAVLAAITTLEAAEISSQSKLDDTALKAELQLELGLEDKAHEMNVKTIDHEHESEMATQAQDSAKEINSDKIAAAPKTNGASKSAAKPAVKPSGLGDMMKRHLSPQPQQDNSEILMALAALTKALTAPQQVTTPEGRTFTSQRILN